MAIVPWKSFKDIDKFFEEDWMPFIPAMPRIWEPAMDIYEDKDNIVVEVPLAGIKPEKVDVTVEGDVLTIKGAKEDKKEEKGKNYWRKEVRSGSFLRSVTLPVEVKGDKAKAESIDGMLKITIPKAVKTKAKKIGVKVVKKDKK